MENSNEPINFIPESEKDRNDSNSTYNYLGLTKREYFASKAMQSMVTFDLGQNYDVAPEIAKRAVIMADALLNELSNP